MANVEKADSSVRLNVRCFWGAAMSLENESDAYVLLYNCRVLSNVRVIG